jgi:hypothetical protein
MEEVAINHTGQPIGGSEGEKRCVNSTDVYIQ